MKEELDNNLIDAVIEGMKNDIDNGDVTAIQALLSFCPVNNLIQFLPEEQWNKFGGLIK